MKFLHIFVHGNERWIFNLSRSFDLYTTTTFFITSKGPSHFRIKPLWALLLLILSPIWHSTGLPYFMHLLAFRRLFWASLSNSYRDFANLYVARRLRLPSCILVSTSKGIWGCYRVASLDGPSLIKEILRKWKHNWATLLLSHCIHPFHLLICLRMIWYRKFQHRA